MTLSELRRVLVEHGVTLTLMPDGRLKPHAPHAPPARLVEALKEHKAALFADPLVIGQQVGHCGSCRRWSPGPWVPYMGECSAGWAAHGLPYGTPAGPVEIQAGHSCAVFGGKGWQVRSTA